MSGIEIVLVVVAVLDAALVWVAVRWLRPAPVLGQELKGGERVIRPGCAVRQGSAVQHIP